MRPYLDLTDPTIGTDVRAKRLRNEAGSSICRTHQLSSILYRAVNGFQEGGTPTLPTPFKGGTSAIERLAETTRKST